MKRLKQFFKTAVTFFIGSVLSKIVSFFLLPIYTAYLLPEQYGEYDFAISIINLIAPIAFFQIWDGMYRVSFEVEHKEEKYRVINNSYVMFPACFLVFLLLFGGINFFIKIEYIGYVICYGVFFALQYVYTYSARIFLDNTLFVISGLFSTIISAGVNIILIVVYKWDVSSLYIAATLGCIVQIIFIEYKIKLLKNFKFHDIDLALIRRLLSFSIPLCIATVSYWLLSGYTKLVITKTLGAYENGLYAVANKFASVITLIVSVFQFAWNEAAYLMAGDRERTTIYSVCVNLILKIALLGSSVGIILVKIVFPFFIDAQYIETVSIVPAVLIGTVVNSVASFLGTLFMTEGKTRFIMKSTIISSIFNLFATYIGTLLWGLQGAVIALLLSFVVLLISRIYYLYTYYEIYVEGAIWWYIVLTGISVLAYYSFVDIKSLCCVAGVLIVIFCFSLRKVIKHIFLRRKNA